MKWRLLNPFWWIFAVGWAALFAIVSWAPILRDDLLEFWEEVLWPNNIKADSGEKLP